MSEIINNSRNRVDKLKKLLYDLHKGVSVEETRALLLNEMKNIPYGEVVLAEEELIKEGLPKEEILKFCDVHTEAMKGNIDTSMSKSVPLGHPVDTLINENKQTTIVLDDLETIFARIKSLDSKKDVTNELNAVHSCFNSLTDLEKHYLKKENLIFPFLEKYGITGPPMVMWGKHDEIRAFMKSSLSFLSESKEINAEIAADGIDLLFKHTVKAIREMIYKEENILYPMCLDTLTEIDWVQVYQQSDEIGYCLYDPQTEWKPSSGISEQTNMKQEGRINLSTGSFTTEELEGFFNSLPLDITFVDKEDKVRFFSHGEDRIFQRNRAILGRQVQYCHPPSSVHIVDQILNDFKSGKQNSAKFWINFHGKYVHIAYYAIRGKDNEYLGTVEVTQDINQYREIEGERRLLTYEK